MRKLFYLLTFLALSVTVNAQTSSGINWGRYFITGSLVVGTGNTNQWADPAALLQIGGDTTTKVFIPARVKDTALVYFPRPLGSTVWQYKDSSFYTWSGSKWKALGSVISGISDVPGLATALNAKADKTITLTINGTIQDISTNRSWTVGTVRTDGSYSNPSWISSLVWSKITGTPTTLAGYGIANLDIPSSVSAPTYAFGRIYANSSTNKIPVGVGGSFQNLATEIWSNGAFIQNGTTMEVGKNFNIEGTGVAFGGLTGGFKGASQNTLWGATSLKGDGTGNPTLIYNLSGVGIVSKHMYQTGSGWWGETVDINENRAAFPPAGSIKITTKSVNGGDGVFSVNVNGTDNLTINKDGTTLNAGSVPDYADNAAAVAAGLPIGRIYRTGDILKIVH